MQTTVRPGYVSPLSIPVAPILENSKPWEGDKADYVFGKEYMAAWHRVLLAMYDVTTVTPKVLVSGDSTTDGAGIVDPRNLLFNAVETTFAEKIGLVEVVNAGHSGHDTAGWKNSFLAADIAAAPHLYILRWGLNDGSQSIRPDFEQNLRAGLATLRAALPVSVCSVILMTPNSTNDVPNGRDSVWHEVMNPIIRRAARDFHCAFIDTYSILRDSDGAHVDWMDDPYGDGRHIHPLDIQNRWIVSEIMKLAIPEGISDFFGSQLVNPSYAQQAPTAAAAPLASFYRKGVSMHRADTGDGWPVNGMVVTHRQFDGVWFQTNSSYLTDNGFAVRRGSSLGWGPWQYMGTSTGVVTAAGGWSLPGSAENMAVIKSGELVSANGYIAQDVPAAIVINSIIGYVQAGFRPTGSPVYGIPMAAYGGGNWEFFRGQIELDGTIRTKEPVALVSDRVYMIGAWPVRVS